MSLNSYLINRNVTTKSFYQIVAEADKGKSLDEIKSILETDLESKEIYAILCRYCNENQGGSISNQYPHLYEEFSEVLDGKREQIDRDIMLRENNKVLRSIWEDLGWLHEESLNRPQL